MRYSGSVCALPQLVPDQAYIEYNGQLDYTSHPNWTYQSQYSPDVSKFAYSMSNYPVSTCAAAIACDSPLKAEMAPGQNFFQFPSQGDGLEMFDPAQQYSPPFSCATTFQFPTPTSTNETTTCDPILPPTDFPDLEFMDVSGSSTDSDRTCKNDRVNRMPDRVTKRRKKNTKGPQKPVSAYALFFHDTQSIVKMSQPEAAFGEISKIVASMWENLDAETKKSYRNKTAEKKKQYLRELASSKASQVVNNNKPRSKVKPTPTKATTERERTQLRNVSAKNSTPNQVPLKPDQLAPFISNQKESLPVPSELLEWAVSQC